MSWSNLSRGRVWGLALVVLVGAIWVVRQDAAIAGGVPPGEGIEVVYLTVGTNFPDALGVGPGAAINGAPIVLVPTEPPIPGVIETELVRLDPRGVVIVGGTAVISDAMKGAVEALLPNAVVARLDGANRYATNAKFLQAIYPVETWTSITAAAFTDTSANSIEFEASAVFNSSTGVLRAPVQLPHSATILELRVEAYDGSVADDLTVNLNRIGSATTGGIMATVTSSGSAGDITLSTTAISESHVDNSDFGYQIVVTSALSTDLKIALVQIRYQLGAP